jgi:enediyne biosynthesis protein E4
MEPQLFRNIGRGRFRDVSDEAGLPFREPVLARAAAFGDLDNDGDTDVVVSNCGQAPVVLRNDGGNRAGWIGLELVGRRSNRDAIGARVKTVAASGLTQYHTVTTASSYLSASDKRLVVGLGGAGGVRLMEIRWPDGTVERRDDVPAGRWLKIEEPD